MPSNWKRMSLAEVSGIFNLEIQFVASSHTMISNFIMRRPNTCLCMLATTTTDSEIHLIDRYLAIFPIAPQNTAPPTPSALRLWEKEDLSRISISGSLNRSISFFASSRSLPRQPTCSTQQTAARACTSAFAIRFGIGLIDFRSPSNGDPLTQTLGPTQPFAASYRFDLFIQKMPQLSLQKLQVFVLA